MSDKHIADLERIEKNLFVTSVQIEKLNLELLAEKYTREEMAKSKPKNYKEEKELIERISASVKCKDYKYFTEIDIRSQIKYEIMKLSWVPLYS